MAGKILYVCQEIFPYLPESEQSALCRQLVQAMQERGNEIRTFMPRYGCINERRNQLHEVIRLSGMNLIIDDNDHQLIIKVASIPVGYGDGYPRSLSNKGYVLIHGQKAPIIGRVCMDQFMVDVTAIEDVEFGDKVVIFGRDGKEFLSVDKLGELSGRFNYEFVCVLNKRIPREYIRHGEVVEQVDSF